MIFSRGGTARNGEDGNAFPSASLMRWGVFEVSRWSPSGCWWGWGDSWPLGSFFRPSMSCRLLPSKASGRDSRSFLGPDEKCLGFFLIFVDGSISCRCQTPSPIFLLFYFILWSFRNINIRWAESSICQEGVWAFSNREEEGLPPF